MIFLYDMDLHNITRNQWQGIAVAKKNEEAKSSILKENREEKETEKITGLCLFL